MFKIFIPIIIFFFSSNLFSNDSLKHNQLFCPDYIFNKYLESVEIFAFEFLTEDQVNIYWGNYGTFFTEYFVTIKGTYRTTLKKIYIEASDTVKQEFSDAEFDIDRKTLKLKMSWSGLESTAECNIVNESDLENYAKLYFDQEILLIENKVKSENKI